MRLNVFNCVTTLTLALAQLLGQVEPAFCIEHENTMVTWAIALHGGVTSLPRDAAPARRDAYLHSLRRALRIGVNVLEQKGTALDAVQSVVVALEDDPLFNAGKGAVFTANGTHELDASIMDGKTLRGGAVAATRILKNPILAARQVMENTRHILLVGAEADAFAVQHGCQKVRQSYYYTPERFQTLQEYFQRNHLPVLQKPGYPLNEREGQLELDTGAVTWQTTEVTGTVGCVALDAQGNLAAATSTGGMTGKLAGRVGDSPILGAGNYADNKSCAVSGTGKGEEYIRHTIAARIAWMVGSQGQDLDQAVDYCLTKVLQPGDGGIIAVDKQGNLSLRANIDGMMRAAADSTGLREVAIWFD